LQDLGVSEVKVTKLEAPELVENQALEFRLQDEGSGKQIKLSLVLDAAMTTALQASAARNLAYPDAVPDTSANLDLVMDVELNVTLRFGQRQLSLREVLDLTSGSVVELDRQVDEPVELVLDGRVVARGEAVIIDGNYGMRITQVLQQVVAA
jgi:flagellar motor switch protein FliN/FliY